MSTVVPPQASPYSYDENMWANTAEGAEIEDPSLTPQLDNILLWCRTPEQAPKVATEVKIHFEQGVPVGLEVNDAKVDCADLANLVGGRLSYGNLLFCF